MQDKIEFGTDAPSRSFSKNARKFLPDLSPENKSGQIDLQFFLHVREELCFKSIEFTLQCRKFHTGDCGGLAELFQGLIALTNHSIIRLEDRLTLCFRTLFPIQDKALYEVLDPRRSGDKELFQRLLTLIVEINIIHHLVDDAYRLEKKEGRMVDAS